PAKLIFLDESGAKTNLTRLCGRAPKGQRVPAKAPQGHWQTTKVFGNVREYRGALALPLLDASGDLHSLQFIGADGAKYFLSGGRITGCFFMLDEKPTGPLVICEGYATGASIHEATGYVTVCAMNCGNLAAVAKALREKWPEREIIIAADNDQWTEGNRGMREAAGAARTVHARLAMPQFKDLASKPTDFNDLHQLEGLDAVKAQIVSATMPTETDEETFARLAKLPQADYDRCRDREAKQLRIRVGTLDEEVAKHLPKSPENLQGGALNLADMELWPEAVNGADLLDEVAQTFPRYIALPDGAADKWRTQ
ncbi:MAG: toprim domain-containing protein, partial [Verrucomicrobiota bacterium]